MEKNEIERIGVAANSLTSFQSFKEMEEFGERIAKSGISPLKKGNDVVAAVLFGRELGLEPMISVNNIYPINGKGTLSVHVINALLQKAGVVVEVLRDFEPCINFGLKGEDGKPLTQKNGEGKEIPIVLREGFADEPTKDHEVRGTKIVNYKTVLKFTRKLKQPDNTWKESVITSSYSIKEAAEAGLSDKDNWVKYKKQMTLNRALAFGGRLIASDILLGMYETSELLDATNTPYKMEEGKVTVIDSKVRKSPDLSNTTNVEAEDINPESSKENDKNINQDIKD